MGMHNIELTDLEREGLELFRLPIGEKSQLSNCFRTGVRFAVNKINKDIIELTKRNCALQAKIDSLMLEFCPEDMTQEQIERWGENQVVSNYSTEDVIEKIVEDPIVPPYTEFVKFR